MDGTKTSPRVLSSSQRLAHVRLTALAVSLTLLLTLGTGSGANADTLYGNDISWPQCPTSDGGFGLPMPPTSADFVIVGLTKGLAFTENPCLDDQVAWLRTHGVPAHGYAMATYPTASQLAAHGGSGPWGSDTLAGRLRNVGYAEASFALQSLARAGWSPPVVWIDVEPRPAQPWPTATAQERLNNRYVIEGLIRGLNLGGVGTGIYSYTAGWDQITDSWDLPHVPVWATAGRLDYPTEAQDRCIQPSFSGGPVYLSQWYDDTRDYDLTCGSYPFTPFDASAFYLNNRFTATADVVFHYGLADGAALAGDWDGNGTETIAVRSGKTYRIRNSNTPGVPDVVVEYGRATDEILVGDWDGDGDDTLAVRRGATYYIKNTLTPGTADLVIIYGRPDDEILVGDWDGDGDDTLAVRRGATYYIKNTLTPGTADLVIIYGRPDDKVLVGDWDGDGDDTLAVRRGATYYIKNTLTPGTADLVIIYGRPGDEVLVGDWDGDGDDTLGVRRTS